MARNGMVFKEIEEGLEEIKSELKIVEGIDDEKEKELKIRLAALLKISKYVEDNEWLVKDKPKEKINVIRISNYDYSFAAKELGVSVGSLHVFMNYAIKRVKEKIGENTVDLIINGDVKIGLVQFYALSGKFSLESLLPPYVFEKMLIEPKFVPFKLEDCKKEISFLKDYSNSTFENRLNALDKDKLSFLRFVLENEKSTFSEEQYDLIGLLSGRHYTKDEYFNKISSEGEYRP
jgi:hypothetical protein